MKRDDAPAREQVYPLPVRGISFARSRDARARKFRFLSRIVEKITGRKGLEETREEGGENAHSTGGRSCDKHLRRHRRPFVVSRASMTFLERLSSEHCRDSLPPCNFTQLLGYLTSLLKKREREKEEIECIEGRFSPGNTRRYRKPVSPLPARSRRSRSLMNFTLPLLRAITVKKADSSPRRRRNRASFGRRARPRISPLAVAAVPGALFLRGSQLRKIRAARYGGKRPAAITVTVARRFLIGPARPTLTSPA